MEIGSRTPDWPEYFQKSYIQQGYWNNDTFGERLAHSAAMYADKVALVDDHGTLTYRTLHQRSLNLAAGLQRLGLRAGDSVVMQLPNINEFVVLSLALLHVGAVAVYALPTHRERELLNFLTITGAVAYFGMSRHQGTDFEAILERLQPHMPSLRLQIFKGASAQALELDDLYCDQAPCLPQIVSNDFALFQISGGTTGLPKLIARRHREYLYSIRESCRICRLDSDTVYLAVLPLGHNYTMSSPGFWGVLLSGGTVVMSSPSLPEALPMIARYGVNMVALVPSLANIWAQSETGGLQDTASLRLIQVGGAKLPASVAQSLITRFRCTLQQVFGMAEGLVCYSGLDDDLGNVIAGHVHPMSSGDEIRVVDEYGQVVAPGQSGHLLTRGPYTIRGYFDALEHNRTAFTDDGFYRTGDLVRQLPEGYLEVIGRDKDQINKGGEKVSPEEVEDAILETGLVRDALVIAQQDAFLGERVVAMIIAHEDTCLRALRTQLRTKIASYKVPDRFELVDAFAFTAIGKMNRKAMRQALQKHADAKVEEHA